VSRFLPAGNYALTAKTEIFDVQHDANTTCQLNAGTTTLDSTTVETDGSTALDDGLNYASLALIGTTPLPQGGTVEVACFTSQDGVSAYNTKIVAIKVNTLN
jgi:hypothetical protein